MNYFCNKDNLFFKCCAIFLIFLHLFTFSNIRDAFAFNAQSASYKLSSGSLTAGGKDRGITYTKLLSHFDGTDGVASTTAETGQLFTFTGNAQLDTAQKKFGSASLLLDGNGDYATVADNSNWNFGNGDFTIDFWAKFSTVSSSGFLEQYVSPSDYWAFYYNAGTFYLVVDDAVISTPAFTPAVNTWYHVALVRNGNLLYTFINGTKIAGSPGNVTGLTMPDVGAVLDVGTNRRMGMYHPGWIEEVRISKGIARWSSNFTPPDTPYNLSDGASPLKLWQDAVGESITGKLTSQNYKLDSGFVATIQPNPPAQTQNISNQSWQENETKTNVFDLDDYFVSPDGYDLNYTISGNSNIAVTIDPATHQVTFSQGAGWSGTEKIKFKATDTENSYTESNEITIQVVGVDNPPVLDFIADITVNENELIKITPHATDADNDNITYTFSTPINSNGEWQTNYTSSGIYTITVTAKDTTNLTDTQEVKLTVRNINQPPVISPIANITVNEGDYAIISPQVTDSDDDAVSVYYSAPFDSTGKWLTGYSDAGTYNITVTASDGIDTITTNAKVIVNNTNRIPQAEIVSTKYTVSPGEGFTLTLSAIDPDSDPMTFSIKKDNEVIASGNLTNSYSTTISFPATGDHAISATVTDSGSLGVTVTKGIDVVDPDADRDYINPVMGDFNGDALSDLGIHNAQNGKWEICLSDKGVFRNAVDWLDNFGASLEWWPIGGDFNGDGKTDIGSYNVKTGELKVALSSGSGFSDSGTWLNFSSPSYQKQECRQYKVCSHFLFITTCEEKTECYNVSVYPWQPFAGNFNADKYTDFAVYNNETGEVRVALGTGSGFGAFAAWLSAAGAGYIAMSGDFNGDSVSDLCLYAKSTGEFKVVFSNTKNFIDPANWLSGFAVDKDRW
ncbi:MAG: LamG-like jellyroll fold domain-containing protein, partial [Candidatus Omnitrophota bacterium]